MAPTLAPHCAAGIGSGDMRNQNRMTIPAIVMLMFGL